MSDAETDKKSEWTIDSLRIYLLDTINERDRKAEQRSISTDKVISDLAQSIKEALSTALSSTKDALETATENTRQALSTANDNIKGALATIDQRFGTVNAQISAMQDSFARKTEIEQAIVAMREANLKSEQANEKRFDQINSLTKQFDKFALQSEVNVKIDALSERLSALRDVVAEGSGKSKGIGVAGTVLLGAVAVMGTLAAIIATLLKIR